MKPNPNWSHPSMAPKSVEVDNPAFMYFEGEKAHAYDPGLLWRVVPPGLDPLLVHLHRIRGTEPVQDLPLASEHPNGPRSLADLLPAQVTYVPISWTLTKNIAGCATTPTFSATPNFNGSGRTLLRWSGECLRYWWH